MRVNIGHRGASVLLLLVAVQLTACAGTPQARYYTLSTLCKGENVEKVPGPDRGDPAWPRPERGVPKKSTEGGADA